MKKSGVWAALAAVTIAIAVPGYSAKAAVVYELNGTAINSPSDNAIFSFTFTAPTFIGGPGQVTLDSCSISDSAFFCTTATFLPATDHDSLGVLDHLNFEWTNTGGGGEGSGQLLFALGAFSAPGTYHVGESSMSADAVLTVRIADLSGVPVPGALPLFASGAGVLGFLGWRRKRKGSTPAA